jgi:hypothetical protein
MCRFISRFVPKQVEVKLIDIVTQTLKYRRDNNVVRHDFLHIMNQIKENSQSAGFSEVDVTAHAAGFFGDGYETSSIVMSFFLFNLSNNPVAQKKLREEIDAAFEDNDNKLPYDVLQGLSYLDAALNGIEIDNFVKIPQFLCRIVANLSTGDLFAKTVHQSVYLHTKDDQQTCYYRRRDYCHFTNIWSAKRSKILRRA